MAFLVAMIKKLKTKVFSLLINDNHLSKRLHVTALQTTHFSGFPFLVKADFCLSPCTFLVSNKFSEIKTIQSAKKTTKTRKV